MESVVVLTPAEVLTGLLGDAGVALARTPRRQQARYLGEATDRSLLVELVGELASPRGLTVVCRMAPDQLEAADRNGRIIDAILALVAPHWTLRATWFRSCCDRFAKARAQLLRDRQSMTIREDALTARVELTFLPNVNQVTLRVRIRDGLKRHPRAAA